MPRFRRSTPADERTLDPCSLIDIAALAQIGPATIRPGYGVFSECVAVIPVGTVPQRFFIAADGAMRAEYVRVIVEGAAETATICRAAVDLAERVATRLPTFG